MPPSCRRRPPPLYYFEWLDHADTGEHPWQDVSELDAEPPLCRTVGWIVKRTPKSFVVAGTISDEQVSSTFILLRSCIVRMVALEVPPTTGTAPAPRRSL